MINKSVSVRSNGILPDRYFCQPVLLPKYEGKKVNMGKICPIMGKICPIMKIEIEKNLHMAVFVRSYHRRPALQITL